MLRQLALLAVLAVPVHVSLAQEVRAVDPAWKVVTRDGVSARCGPESVFYSVGEFKAGRVLMMDGVADAQSRVRYPDDIAAMVPADEVRVIDDRTVELTKTSGLRAPSELLGISGSWKALFEPGLPAGTRLTVREALKNRQGDVVGYKVATPKGSDETGYAWAFVATDALRDATPEEIAKAGSTPPVQNKPVNNAGTPSPAGNPGGNQPAGANPATEPGNAAPQTTPATQGTDAGDRTPVEVSPEEGVRPAEVEAAPVPSGPVIKASKLEDLEASFEATRQMPTAELDQALDELLAEFQRTREESSDDERLSAQLDMRIEWIKLRLATRDQRRAIESALAQADDRAKALQGQANDWQKSRAFQLVGRLVQSSVYNGERLPKMYRVQAVSTLDGTPRTLGYLMPSESLESKLGSIVGIVGESRFDPQLRLVVIKPDRVEVMPQ